MPAKKKAKAAKKKAARKPRATPKPDPPAEPPAKPPVEQPDPPAADTAPKRKAGQRVASVRSRRPSFNRAGLSFSADTPVTVREDEIGSERFERIINEPMLRVELQ